MKNKECVHAWEQFGDQWQCFECGEVTALDPNKNPLFDDEFKGCPAALTKVETAVRIKMDIHRYEPQFLIVPMTYPRLGMLPYQVAVFFNGDKDLVIPSRALFFGAN